MAKWANDLMMDASLDYVAGSVRMVACSAQPANYAGIAAVAVAEPQARCGAVEQRIAGAFEFDVQRGHVEIAFGEPAGEMRLFARAFGVAEMAGHGAAAVDQAGIGGEHHVRQPGHLFDQCHLGRIGHQLAQGVPLARGALAVGPVAVAGHPGVDVVVHRKVGGRAHQHARTGRSGHGGRLG